MTLLHPSLRCGTSKRLLSSRHRSKNTLCGTFGMIDQLGRVGKLDLMQLELVDVERLDRAVAASDHIQIEIDRRHRGL